MLTIPARRRSRPSLTPLIDVVFLLLIFFMVSASFNRDTQIKLELPEASGDPMEALPELIEISVDSEGRYFVKAKPVVNTQVETLVKAIQLVGKGNDKIPVMISADAGAPFQSVMTAMDASRKAGYFNFSMATKHPQSKQ